MTQAILCLGKFGHGIFEGIPLCDLVLQLVCMDRMHGRHQ